MDPQGNEEYELPVTYREVTEMPSGVEDENIIEQSPHQYKNLEIDNGEFVEETSEGERYVKHRNFRY